MRTWWNEAGQRSKIHVLLQVLPFEQRLNLFLVQVEARDLLEPLDVVVHVILVAILVRNVRLPLHLLQKLAQRLFILFAVPDFIQKIGFFSNEEMVQEDLVY